MDGAGKEAKELRWSLGWYNNAEDGFTLAGNVVPGI